MSKKIAVQCATLEEYLAVQRHEFAKGKTWVGTQGEDQIGWRSYGSKACIDISQPMTYADLECFARYSDSYTIIPAAEYLGQGTDVALLEKAVAAARQKLEEAEAKLKEATEVKVGDWMVVIEESGDVKNGQMCLVTTIDANAGGLVNGITTCYGLDGLTGLYHSTRFRKATPSETAAAQKLKIVVDGKVYLADFIAGPAGTVTFGCAEIDHEIFLALNKALKSKLKSKGNRDVTSVTIGKGVFSPDLIDRICTRITNLNTTPNAKSS